MVLTQIYADLLRFSQILFFYIIKYGVLLFMDSEILAMRKSIVQNLTITDPACTINCVHNP